jgi:hypothetical protein
MAKAGTPLAILKNDSYTTDYIITSRIKEFGFFFISIVVR